MIFIYYKYVCELFPVSIIHPELASKSPKVSYNVKTAIV